MNTVLSIRDLTVTLPRGGERSHAVKSLSLEVSQGEILCVVGESGSGKSLTSSAILGLLPEGVNVTGGEILLQGQDLLSISSEDLRKLRGSRIGMIFQEPMTALNPLRTIGDQIAEVFRAHTRLSISIIRKKTIELLESVHIPDPEKAARAYPHELSGGQRQRAMIAMALALEPVLLIADEPTTALDVTTQAQILRLIKDLQQRRGTAVLFITHDFGVVAEIADKVVVMQRGELVESGTATEVLNQPVHPYSRTLIAAVPSLKPSNISRLNRVSASQPILELKGVSKTYQRMGLFKNNHRVTHAVKDVSLSLSPGTTLGIVGESGSGKSTLARIILGLIEPDEGSVSVEGAPKNARTRAERQQRARLVQMVFQDPYGSLNPRRKVGDIVAQGPVAHGVPCSDAWKRAQRLFDLVGLDADAVHRYPHEFSGGQRQRIGLARALALEPSVLLADEPVSALDVSVQAQVLDLLQQLKDELGLSMLFITHDLRVAAQVSDRVAVMKEGQIVEEAAVGDLFRVPVHTYTKGLLAAVPGRDWAPPEFLLRQAA